MTSTRSGRRRSGAAVVGALGGAVGGLGGSIVVTQSGRIDVDVGITMLVASIVVGAVVGFVEPPRWVDRVLTVAILAGAVGVGVVGVGAPAGAQGACTVTASVAGTAHDLGRTTRDEPFVVDIGREPEIVFEVVAPGVRRGLVEVVVAGIDPPLWPTDDRLVFVSELVDGSARESVRIERAGWTGFRVVSPDERSPLIPLGVVELGIVVVDDDGAVDDGCPDTAWVRAVATPADNPLGQVGLGSTFAGAGIVALAGPLRRLRRGPSRSSQGADEAPEPSPPVGHDEPIGASGPHAEHTDVRIRDAAGRQVDPAAPLVAGRPYEISITFGLGLAGAEVADRAEHAAHGRAAGLTAVASSRSLGLAPQVAVGSPGQPISVPIVPTRPGRQRVSIDALHRGHHVQTERVDFTVVADEGAAIAEPQTTTTLISTVAPTASALDDLPPRQVLVILEHDERDGSIDARILGEDGRPIVEYDTTLQAQALDAASAEVRDALGRMLEVARHGLDLDRDALADAGSPVVVAGRQLAMALFPDTVVDPTQVHLLADRVADGATVQIVTHRAGVGHATVPWALVHDHRFIRRAAGNPVCDSFETHPVDACPHEGDPQVWCPTGFWGYRAIVEELWSSTEMIDVQPLVPASAPSASTNVVAYLDPELAPSAVQTRTITRLGGRCLSDFDEVVGWLADDDPDLDLVYLYAHHQEGPGGGLRIGDDLLSAVTLDALRDHRRGRWPHRPLVVVNGCATGASASTAPVSLLDEFRSYGAGGAVTSECTVWDGLAGECGLRLLDGLAAGRPVGAVVTAMRRDLLREHRNPVGFAYRLLARADTTLSSSGSP